MTRKGRICSSFETARLEEVVLEVDQVMAFQVAKCCLVTLSQLLPNLEHALAPRGQQTTASDLLMQLSVQPAAVAPRCRAHGMYY